MRTSPELTGRTLWDGGREPGRQMVALAVALTLSAIVLDITLGQDLGLFFDLCFVALCVTIALQVRPRDFFTVGVLPPLVMLGGFVLLDLTRPEVLGDPKDGVVQSVVTGLAQHSGALVAGYLLCLVVLAVRHHYSTQAAKRPGSPAPTRTTSG